MMHGRMAALLLVVLLAACDGDRRNDTSVLGGYGPRAAGEGSGLLDGRGRAIPPPPAPQGARVRMVRSADDTALAAWVQDDHVVATTWTRAAGWSAPEPLERIYGESTEVELASNGEGQAMAVWHHRVGNIHSLRFSRFDANGWSLADVLPGALPRPIVAGTPPGEGAPQLHMEPDGSVVARWPSGFRANEMQVSRYTPAEGWSRAASEALAAAPPAPDAAASAPAR